MDEVALDLDRGMVDALAREAEDHGFDDLDGYVRWVLERRDIVLAEHDVPERSPDVGTDAGSTTEAKWETIDGDAEGEAAAGAEGETVGDETAGDQPPEEELEEVELPEEDGADDDDVAAALEEIDFDDEE